MGRKNRNEGTKVEQDEQADEFWRWLLSDLKREVSSESDLSY